MTLYKKLREINWCATNGDKVEFQRTYNLRVEDDVDQLDRDSVVAVEEVEKFDLSYDINARHYSTVTKGDKIEDLVEVTWTFWVKN